jgi:hypothetical protein
MEKQCRVHIQKAAALKNGVLPSPAPELTCIHMKSEKRQF